MDSEGKGISRRDFIRIVGTAALAGQKPNAAKVPNERLAKRLVVHNNEGGNEREQISTHNTFPDDSHDASAVHPALDRGR